MQTRVVTLLALALGLPAASALAADPCKGSSTPECKAVAESRCRKANDEMLAQTRQLPAASASEKQRKAELLAQVQKLVDTNRRNRVDECQTWAEFNRIAARQ